LCDFNNQRLSEAKKKYPDMRCVQNANDILKASDIDVVTIASYDNYHHQQILTAIEHGKHIFVEKPLCLHSSEARDIRKILNRNKNLKISSNLILRKCPRFAEIHRRISLGLMGEIFSIEGSYDYGRRHKIINSWRGAIDSYSGICGGGVHIIDLFLWFSGQKVSELMAYGNQIVMKGTQFRYKDSVTAILQFEKGATAKVSVHLGSVTPHYHELNVYGTKATFMNNFGRPLFFSSDDPSREPEVLTQEYPGVHKGALIYNFIESIVSGEKLEICVEDIFAAMSICFAINQSLESGKKVKVKYI